MHTLYRRVLNIIWRFDYVYSCLIRFMYSKCFCIKVQYIQVHTISISITIYIHTLIFLWYICIDLKHRSVFGWTDVIFISYPCKALILSTTSSVDCVSLKSLLLVGFITAVFTNVKSSWHLSFSNIKEEATTSIFLGYTDSVLFYV